jgi:hypothetical protein
MLSSNYHVPLLSHSTGSNIAAESIGLTPHAISLDLLNAQESESCPTKTA